MFLSVLYYILASIQRVLQDDFMKYYIEFLKLFLGQMLYDMKDQSVITYTYIAHFCYTTRYITRPMPYHDNSLYP